MVKTYIWSAVGLVILAYVLMGFVKELMPVLIVLGVLYALGCFVFKRRW